MSSRLHFGATPPQDGYSVISTVAKREIPAFDSIMSLMNAAKISLPKEENKINAIASDLRDRALHQISAKRKFFESILSTFLSCFGYKSTEDKVKTAFSVIIRKDKDHLYEVVNTESQSPAPSKAEKNEEKGSESDVGDNEETPEDKEAQKKAERDAQNARLKEKREALEKKRQEEKEKIEKAAKEAEEKKAKEAEEAARVKAETEAKEKAEKDAATAKENAEKEAKEKADQEAKDKLAEEEKAAKAKEDARIKHEQDALDKLLKEAVLREKEEEEIKKYANLQFDEVDEKGDPVQFSTSKEPQSEKEIQEELKRKIEIIEEKLPKEKAAKVIKEVIENGHIQLDTLHQRQAKERMQHDELQNAIAYSKSLYVLADQKLIKNNAIINDLLTEGDYQEVAQIVQGFPKEVVDIAFSKLSLSCSQGNFAVARFFAMHIQSPVMRDECLNMGGLNTVEESIFKSAQSESGKLIAKLISEKKFDEALNSIKDSTYLFWIQDSAIRFFINNGQGDKAQEYINKVNRQDLKTRYHQLYFAKYLYQNICNYLANEVPHDPNQPSNIINALMYLSQGKIVESLQAAFTLSTVVFKSNYIHKLADHYIANKQFVEALDIVPFIENKRISQDAYLEIISSGQIENGEITDAIETLKRLNDDQFKQNLINTYKDNPYLVEAIASTMSPSPKENT